MTRNLVEFDNQIEPVENELRSCAYTKDHIVVLMALFNGAATLPDQLGSISEQTHKNWSLIISDDGSQDDWLTPISKFAAKHTGRTWLVQGPKRGSTQNFLELIHLAGPMVPYAALCDQDDVWLPPKLERALYILKDVSPSIPALYVAPTFICDKDLTPLRKSKFFRFPPSFSNALVQSIDGGNTMVLNRAALDLVQETARHAGSVKAHDWWIYQIVSGAGGIVRYDQMPLVLYRQHGANQIGANDTIGASLSRIRMVMQGRFSRWNKANIQALEAANHWLAPSSRGILEEFQTGRLGRSMLQRVAAARRAGLYRQTLRGQIALWLATLFRRL